MELYGAGAGNYGQTFASSDCPTASSPPDPIFYTDTKIRQILASARASNGTVYLKCATGGTTAAAASSWAVASPLGGNFATPWWCTDSSGQKKLSYVHQSLFMTIAEFFITPVFAVVVGPNLGGGTGTAATCP